VTTDGASPEVLAASIETLVGPDLARE